MGEQHNVSISPRTPDVSPYTPDVSPKSSKVGAFLLHPPPIQRKNLRFRASKKPEGDEPYPAKRRHSFIFPHQKEHYCL